MTRHQLALAALATAIITGCGRTVIGVPAVSKVPTPSTAIPSTPNASTRGPSATAPPSPAPTPAPPTPPLGVIQEIGGDINVAGSSGARQWRLTRDRLLQLGHGTLPQVYAAGRHLLLALEDGGVLIFDSAGAVVAGGHAKTGSWLFPNPDGTRWAWNEDHTDHTSSGSNQTHGAIWVAGIGEGPHRLFDWSHSDGSVDNISLWADRGIVLARWQYACGAEQEMYDLLLAPAAGTTTPLSGSTYHLADFHGGLIAGYHNDWQARLSTVTVAGSRSLKITYPNLPADAHIGEVHISPDATRVAVAFTEEAGCGGRPVAWTDVITVTDGRHTRVSEQYSLSWWDDNALVSSRPGDQTNALMIGSLADAHVTVLGHGSLLGVLR